MKWGIIGLGGIAQRFTKSAFRNNPSHEIVAIASRSADKCNSFLSKVISDSGSDSGSAQSSSNSNSNSILIFTSYSDLILSSVVEAVYITLPSSLHRTVVEMAVSVSKAYLHDINHFNFILNSY
jgi:predicted dehydrogenase